MNYFKLFSLPVSFNTDATILRKRYAALKRETVAEEEILVVDMAYLVLQDQDETIKYILEFKNMLPENEVHQLSPQFLLETGDLNEELMELEMDDQQEQLINVEQKVNRLMLKIYEDVAPVIESDKEDSLTEEALLQVKDFYHQKKYLQRILDRITGIRNIASP